MSDQVILQFRSTYVYRITDLSAITDTTCTSFELPWEVWLIWSRALVVNGLIRPIYVVWRPIVKYVPFNLWIYWALTAILPHVKWRESDVLVLIRFRGRYIYFDINIEEYIRDILYSLFLICIFNVLEIVPLSMYLILRTAITRCQQ